MSEPENNYELFISVISPKKIILLYCFHITNQQKSNAVQEW